MTPRSGPKCLECQKTESLLWRNVEHGQICQECFEEKEKLEAEKTADQEKLKDEKSREVKEKEQQDNSGAANDNKFTSNDEKRLRKSTRATRFKNKPSAAATQPSNVQQNGNSAGGGGVSNNVSSAGKAQSKGRNRRNIFKKVPFKTPSAQATTHSVECVFYKGSYLQVGDIVSLVDGEQNVYYAQIRGLLVDNYCEKSAYLTWLIPTQASPDPKDGFDAATYLIGPDEELSRKLSCLEFVMHAPSNYYLDRTTPFPLPDSMELESKSGGYIWTTLPEVTRRKSLSL